MLNNPSVMLLSCHFLSPFSSGISRVFQKNKGIHGSLMEVSEMTLK